MGFKVSIDLDGESSGVGYERRAADLGLVNGAIGRMLATCNIHECGWV